MNGYRDTVVKALILLAFFIGLNVSQAAGIQPGDKQPLPDIRWQDADGNIHHLTDSNGHSRILHFWAAWCVPCRQEMPELLKWKAANPGIEVIPLSLDQRMAQARYFIKKYQLDMEPLLLNKEDNKALGIPALPYTLFVSADGRLLGRQYGMASWESDAFNTEVKNLFAITP
jgi:thiol-disulfide isomerase/thioredoxin